MPSHRPTATARIAADLIDRAHRRAGELRAAGDRDATATRLLTEWADTGAAVTERTRTPDGRAARRSSPAEPRDHRSRPDDR